MFPTGETGKITGKRYKFIEILYHMKWHYRAPMKCQTASTVYCPTGQQPPVSLANFGVVVVISISINLMFSLFKVQSNVCTEIITGWNRNFKIFVFCSFPKYLCLLWNFVDMFSPGDLLSAELKQFGQIYREIMTAFGYIRSSKISNMFF